MTEPAPSDAITTYIDSTAKLLVLPIRSDHRDGVETNFRRLAAMAELLNAHPFRFEDEPAPVLHPRGLP